MYKDNLNNIDNQLKLLFNKIDYNTNDHRKISISATSPISETVNSELKLEMEVSTDKIKDIDPVVSYSYYTNPNTKDNKIDFNTKIGKMSEILSSVVENNRFNTEYLESLKS